MGVGAEAIIAVHDLTLIRDIGGHVVNEIMKNCAQNAGLRAKANCKAISYFL